ncbi:uncharacterized protein LOC121640503 isoform X2 [Melanotaenia boesemani]|uniref:uncharacterized protein LOC121640503 isoform X2 n=1 Tax=Melanotaenia boesemani TaxID=1250792 RepID=UPI001C04D5E6|nr:uncharacterized protein LOC121640503 isoform X2 [Melanotaenia boesemani]
MAAGYLAGIILCIYGCASVTGQTNITAEPGHDVSLPCRAGHDGDITSVDWIRPDLDPEYVLLYRDGRFYLSHQHPSFQNRVDLQDRQMKDGDVSLILKNLMTNDTGTYECRVLQKGTNTVFTESIIHLEVSPSGTTQDGRNQDGGDKDGGHYRLIVGLSAGVIIVMVLGFWIYKRVQKKNSAPSSSSFISRDEGENESEANILCVEAPTDQEKHQNSSLVSAAISSRD